MYKRCIAFMLLLCVLLTGLPVENLRAATSGDTLYTQMFSTETSAYYMTCQPDSAIILQPSVTLDYDSLSPNYRGGIVDLPRLQVGYYYTVSGKFKLLNTLYPTLGWNEDAIGSSATLSIRSQDTGRTMKTVTIKVPAGVRLHGMDYWYPNEDTTELADIASADALWAKDGIWSGLKITKKTWKDCSDSIVQDLVSNGITAYDGNYALYESAMHRDCVVMNTYVYCSDASKSYECLQGKTSKSIDFHESAYDLSRYAIDEDTIVSTQIKDYLGTLNNGAVRPGLLFYGSKTEGCEFNPTAGTCKTMLEAGNSDTLYYFIALSNKCYLYKMDTSVTKDVLDETATDSPSMVWEANLHYNLQSENTYDTAGFKSSTVSMGYGPLNFETCLENAGEEYVMDGKYGVTQTFMKPQENINLYAESLIYPGCVPHFANVEIKAALYQVTINYYIKHPETDNYVLLFDSPLVYNAAIFKDAELPSIPEIEDYKSRCWYIDQGLKTKFDQSTVDTKANSTKSLYGDYIYVGGTYKVRFYDERTGYDKVFIMQANKKPTLPPTLMDDTGFVFKNWMIVNDVSDTEGQVYDVADFSPIANSEYLFKATWSNRGGIVSIETTKSDYVIGETLNPNTVKIRVVDDNGEHIATTDEFTLDTTVLNKVGTITVTATLRASGVSGTFTVSVADLTAESISAKYKGGSVYVGREIQPADVEVTVYYNNGSSSTTSEFTISPPTILNEGVNTISIYYLDLESAITISGIRYDDTDEKEDGKKLVDIDADFISEYIYMTDELTPEDIIAIAMYDDGSEVTLTPEQFRISPTKFTTPGINYVTVEYGGMSMSVEIRVRSKGSANTSNSGDYVVVGTPSSGSGDLGDNTLEGIHGTGDSGDDNSDGTLGGISGTGSKDDESSGNVPGGLYGTGTEIELPDPDKDDSTQISGVGSIPADKNPKPTRPSKPQSNTTPSTPAPTTATTSHVEQQKPNNTGTSTGNSTHNDALEGGQTGSNIGFSGITTNVTSQPTVPNTIVNPINPVTGNDGDNSSVGGTSTTGNTGNNEGNDSTGSSVGDSSTGSDDTSNSNGDDDRNSSGNGGNSGSSGNSSGGNAVDDLINNITNKQSTDASVGYLDGATILTNTMGMTGLETASVDIAFMLKHSKKNRDVYIDLPNGSNSNILTSDMLSMIKRKNLTVHLNMVKPTDLNTTLAKWTIVGRKIDTSSTNVNPNITFEVTDKSSDRLVYFAIADGTYPEGCSLVITPEANCYSSGDLCRLYSCDINKGNAYITSTVVWQDGANNFVYDVYGRHSYCLSNSPNSYAEGASLLEVNGMPSSFEGEPTDSGDTGNDDTFVNDDYPQSGDKDDRLSDLFKTIATTAAGVLGVAIVLGIMLFIVRRIRKLRGNSNRKNVHAPEPAPHEVRKPVQNLEEINFDTLSDTDGEDIQ